MDERGAVRFNPNHAAAGSATGGQFAAASGSSGGAAKATPSNAHPVGQGETGKRVSDLQSRLNALGFKPALKVDGIFGPKTLAAVKAFQVSHGLKADGMVGPKTTAALRGPHPASHHHKAPHPAKAAAAAKVKAATTAKPAPSAVAPKAAPVAHRAGGQAAHPGDTEKLHEYWVHGEGAAKIRWGEPDDFDRCVEHLGKFMDDPKGYCNLAHKAATGMYPATHAAMDKKAAGRSAVTVTAERADAKAKPYGDVSYADPKNGKYPINSADRARAALSYISMPKNAAQYPMNGVTLSQVKDRIMAACKKFGIDVSDGDSDTSEGTADKASASRARGVPFEAVYFRTYELEDIHIVRAVQGDSTGRLVEAYATAFNSPAEIHDQQGHYLEEIDPAAFNKVLADIGRSRAGFGKVKVIFNHGLTIHGTPSERGSMPIGRAMEIRPEARGLLTLTRYSETPFADEVLENIRNGAITAQSFTGRIVRSDPELRGRGDTYRPRGGQLPTVRRHELGLKEFGPTPFEAYSGAEIVGVRMSAPGTWQAAEDGEQYDDEALPPDEEAAAGSPLTRTDGDEVVHEARYHQHALYALRAREARERLGLVW